MTARSICYTMYITARPNQIKRSGNLLIKMDFQSDVPIYQQLKNEIIIGIASGQLLQGESLPSVRQFASDIGVNLHTINKAYNQLKAEGMSL